MLAPTLDGGAIRQAGPDVDHEAKGWYTERLFPIDPLAVFILSAVSGLAVLWLVVFHRGRALHRLWHSKGLSRAPPLILQPS